MDYEIIKEAVKAISEIALTVPDPFRERSFEILLKSYLDQERNLNPQLEPAPTPPPPAPPPPSSPPGQGIPLTAQVRVFMRRTGVTEEELNSVLLYDGNEVYFVREPATNIVLRSQNEWALLLALKNAIIKGEFTADPEDVRSICKAKGYYDPLNFAKHFKKKKYASYFKKPLEAQGEPQPLTNEGQLALAEVIHSLSGTST
jgi:hypothetical protein